MSVLFEGTEGLELEVLTQSSQSSYLIPFCTFTGYWVDHSYVDVEARECLFARP